MITRFNVGDKLQFKGEVEYIAIDSSNDISYRVTIKHPEFYSQTVWFRECHEALEAEETNEKDHV